VCTNEFKPFRTTDRVCESYICRSTWSQQKREQAEERKAKNKAASKAEQGRSTREASAQIWFNRYIRVIRDKGKPCISCGTFDGPFHCGHYRSVGSAPELRFCEDNAHRQCKECNIDKSGNHLAYREALKKRIGLKRFEVVESYHPQNHYTIQELIDIENYYKQLCKELE